ncbi:homocysteine S-methyltransferase family protein [Sulfitobacter sp. F26204]|uniref:homocysteine S-methyltransferase family protein n=1 Tax=Sulfitobacter sp. F26204 TaxID=2996014 RepID=UPI00225E5A04|nr:homocysteine S-methyltransferase family protein [Sulfitobacter sp. F26204]MCX7557989.1 homocysteine S-methyltransferase family protein [Sulfitobacter sp. F26204]
MTGITLLDGGMGQELVHRAGDRPTPLWSTQVMMDCPGLVAQVHRDFAKAGASVATTNTYAIHRDRLSGTEVADQFDSLLRMALDEVRNCGSARVAGAIGPLRASYRPDLHPASAEAVPLFAEVARTLAPACDLLIAETVVSIAHARDVLAATCGYHKPVWLSLSVRDKDGTELRSGEALADVLPVIAQSDAAAVLVNCSAPEAIPAALDILAQSGLPYGAYANGFEQISAGFLTARPTVDSLTARHDLTPKFYAEHAMAWVDQGATIIGGCCEVSPAHIAEIARRLRLAGHTII